VQPQLIHLANLEAAEASFTVEGDLNGHHMSDDERSVGLIHFYYEGVIIGDEVEESER